PVANKSNPWNNPALSSKINFRRNASAKTGDWGKNTQKVSGVAGKGFEPLTFGFLKVIPIMSPTGTPGCPTPLSKVSNRV
ncbi:unnamed protein product, partial [marine sediment metagenome]